MVFLKFIGYISIFLLLTVLTQIGGLIWVLSLWLSKRWKKKIYIVFLIIYLSFNLLLTPVIASIFGRTQLPIYESTLKSHNIIYPLLFRNYVTKDLYTVLKKSAKDLEESNIAITYLDANFPFFNGFPLLPHLSHNDGKKVDIAFQYKTKKGQSTNDKNSLLGYGIYTNSQNRINTYCKSTGFWQYDMTKYLGITTNKDLILDKNRTKTLILSLLRHTKDSKIFIEPYLKQELGLQPYNAVRFHGCQAVRHDDHIHLQIK